MKALAGESIKIVTPGSGKRLRVVGDSAFVLLSGEDTGGAFSLLFYTAPPNGGPPRHVHHREEETFYVLEGEFEFLRGDTLVKAGPGTVVYAVRDVPHTFRNIGDMEGRLLIQISPAGFEKFFEQVEEETEAGRCTQEKLTSLAATYGCDILGPPLGG